MGSYMHMLREALRAHLSNNGTSVETSLAVDDAGHFTGFLLEDVRVNTSMPTNMDGEVNPLVELLYGEDKSQFQINRLQDHLARIEMKVQQLESRVPYSIRQRLLVAPAEMDDDSDTEADDEDDSLGEKRKSSLKKQPESKGNKAKEPNSKEKNQDKSAKAGNKDEHEKKNCFARLFFSKCWSGNQGRNDKAGWNLKSCCNKPNRIKKGACPAYSTCPCGDDAPCAKIEKKPCPANQKKSGGGKGKSGDGKGKSGDGKGTSSKGNKEKNEKCKKKKKDENPLSALCEKFCNAPCIFSRKNDEDGEGKSGWRCGVCKRKKHVHTPCCCRCKDNPPLPEEKKNKKDGQKAKQQPGKKAGDNASSAEPAKNAGDKQQQKAKDSVTSGESYETGEDDDISVHSAIILPKNDGKDPTQEPMRCIGCTNCDDIRSSRRATKKGTIQMSKKQETSNVTEDIVTKDVTIKSKDEIEVVPKSSTHFQVLLPPSISSESSDHNMVSHQILKTLSTIHGPIRVEQKIVVKGTKNAYVIVTHGEACECNVCSTLKSDPITDKIDDGNPTVVRFPTDNGCDTLVNHSDNCQCTLCSVLEQGITEDVPKMKMEKSPSRIVWTSWSKNKMGNSANVSSYSVIQDSPSNMDETKNFEYKDCSTCEGQNLGEMFKNKKHCHKNKEEKSRKNKCHCFKCVKRRKVRRLKKRFKQVLEPSDLSQVLRALSHHGFTVEQNLKDDASPNGYDEDDENMRKVSRTSSKRVSFSGDTKEVASTDSGNTALLNESQDISDGNPLKRKSKGSKEVSPKFLRKRENELASPQSMNSKFISKPCDCVVCNTKYPQTLRRMNTQPKIARSRPSKDEEQTCFPDRSKPPPKCGCRKGTNTSENDRLREKMLDDVTHPDDEFIRPPTRCEPGCTGRCRFLTPRDEITHLRTDQLTPVVLQASRERLPPKILYWLPSSQNLAAAFSSESYYVPEIEEFPTSDRETIEHPTPYPSQREQFQMSSQAQPGSSSGSRRSRTVKDMNFH